MNEIQTWGIDFILALQSFQSPLLDNFFYLVSQLGGFAYVLVIPLLVWCIEPRLGLRTLLAMMISQYFVMLITDIVQEPRPFMADSRIISGGERGFSFPSGHAMSSMVFYGLLMLWADKTWLRALLAALILLIGLSHTYLGAHYPHEVLTGWVLGIVYLYGWLKLQKLSEDNLYRMTVSRQRLWSLVLPAIAGTAHYTVFDHFGALLIAGAVSAGLLCLITERKKSSIDIQASPGQQIGRYIIGIGLTLPVLVAFKHLYPAEENPLYSIVAWSHGAAVVGMIGYAAPWVFAKVKLNKS